MLPRIFLLSIAGMALLATLIHPSPLIAQANDPSYGLNTTRSVAGFPDSANKEDSLNKIIIGIIQTLLSLTGVIFMGLIIYAGNLWMTAGGNEEQVTHARSIIINAAIGMAAIFAAYIVTNFVVDTVVTFVTG